MGVPGGLGLLLAGLPLSLYLMSVSQLMLSVNWLLEGRFRKKWHSFRAQPEAGIFLLIFLLHVIWLWNTRDFDYALKDLRTKLPLLALPIIRQQQACVTGNTEASAAGLCNCGPIWKFQEYRHMADAGSE